MSQSPVDEGDDVILMRQDGALVSLETQQNEEQNNNLNAQENTTGPQISTVNGGTIGELLESTAALHRRHRSLKYDPFWKQGPGWQIWVLSVQTLFIFAKLLQVNVANILLTWIYWWVVLLPLWVSLTLYTGSLILWIIKDAYKWKRSNDRYQRRVMRHEARLQQIRSDFPHHSELRLGPLRSPRSERRMFRKRVDRFYAVSTLFFCLISTSGLFMLTLKLDLVTQINSLYIVLPFVIYGFLHCTLATILLGSLWRLSQRNGGEFAVKNRLQTILLTIVIFVLISVSMVLIGLKVDYSIQTEMLSYNMCFIPLYILNGILCISAIYMFILSFLKARSFVKMFESRRPSQDEEEDVSSHNMMTVDDSKKLTLHRLDVIIFLILQIPVNVFLAQLGSFISRSTTDNLDTFDYLVLFLTPFVAEIIACTWTISRNAVVKLIYRREASNPDAEDQDLELGENNGTAADQENGNQFIVEDVTRTHVDRSRNINPFMLLYLRSLLQNVDNDEDERVNVNFLEWLQEQHEVGGMNRLHLFRNRPVGVSEDFLNVLPTFSYKKKDQNQVQEGDLSVELTFENCTICLSEYEEEEVLRTLPCFHIFHRECIDDWLKQSRVCPVCKHQVDSFGSTNEEPN
ncbi:E3 ubiquitin-protein ligase [Acrasis kona]|uniref:E3 ubiquitin-protein ligase n=1 Tax=Acrasis kona TaxID=1008807 RepID=A0AAW2YLQ9_9EUKA